MSAQIIVLEGIDGSGKSTIAKLLAKKLGRGKAKVKIFREPGSSLVSEKIRDILLDSKHKMEDVTEAMLFAAARYEFVKSVLVPAKTEYDYIILDRFVESSMVYQGVGRGLGIDYIKDINSKSIDLIGDYWAVLLDIDISTSLKRMDKDKLDRMDDVMLQSKISFREEYKKIFRNRTYHTVMIDATHPLDLVSKSVYNEVYAKWIV